MGMGHFILVTDKRPEDVLESVSINPDAATFIALGESTTTFMVAIDCSAPVLCDNCGNYPCAGCKQGFILISEGPSNCVLCFLCIETNPTEYRQRGETLTLTQQCPN